MRLPVPRRMRLFRDLLLLTLLLGTVCGMQKKPRRPGAQPGNPLGKAQGDVAVRKDEQSERTSKPVSHPDNAKLLGHIFLDDQEVTPAPGDEKEAHGRPENSDAEQEENKDLGGAGMKSRGQQRPAYIKTRDGKTCEISLACTSFQLVLYVNFVEQELPSCPCTYPVRAREGVVSLLDEHQEVEFEWRDASSPEELPESAHSCLRSLPSVSSNVLASQHCCYDAQGLLLTHGNGAGTPDLISPDMTADLFLALSHLPWSQCKEEWTYHQALMPPNNGLSCPENPSKENNLDQSQEIVEA